MAIPHITFNNGVKFPQFGLGTYQTPDDTLADIVVEAIEIGYTAFDTAALYANEAGLARGIAASGVAREDLFITSKVWNSDQGYDNTIKAFETSLRKLDTEYLDLYLIHWPMPSVGLYLETWRALEHLYAQKKVRAIGVSNFSHNHLFHLRANSEIVPVVNQVELHPYFQQRALREFHAGQNIRTEAWAPMAKGQLLDNPVLGAIAEKHGKTVSQVAIRWHLDVGNIVIPKTVTPARLAENFDVFDFELDQIDLGQIASIDKNQRLGGDPEEYTGGWEG